ncbi:hypothetical protein ABZ960_20635 [Streptomyces pseudovenezuelae]|uniref:hypothetical protein n=1 Tax=Streptomyces pseudovenezuelae TaxID=67350 RepID=UPI0034A0EF0D
MKDRLTALVEKYGAREEKREADIQSYRDGVGNLKEEYEWEEYDLAVDDAGQDARKDLRVVLAALRELIK